MNSTTKYVNIALSIEKIKNSRIADKSVAFYQYQWLKL